MESDSFVVRLPSPEALIVIRKINFEGRFVRLLVDMTVELFGILPCFALGA